MSDTNSSIARIEQSISNPHPEVRSEPVMRAELTAEGLEAMRNAILDFAADFNRRSTDKNANFLKQLIEKIASSHEDTQGEKIAAGISGAFIHTFPHIRLGGIYKIKKGAQYKVTKPGRMVAITNIVLGTTGTLMPPNKPQVTCISLDKKGRVDNDAEKFEIAVDDLEPVSDEKRAAVLKVWAEPIVAHEPLEDGTWVRLKQDVTLSLRNYFGVKTMLLPEGLAGIIDTPDQNGGRSMSDANEPEFTPPTVTVEFGWHVNLQHSCGWALPLDFNHFRQALPVAGYGYKYSVYVPSMRGHIEVDQSVIEKRPFNETALRDVIMSSTIRRKLMVAISDTAEDLRKWGLESFTKGKGTLILSAGGPGLGKTYTAEATAEHLKRPLFIIENNMFGTTPAEFEAGLKMILERAKRWNPVFLWDECEVFLQHRGTNPEQNARITAALRLLESFEGLMFLTTNRPRMIDEAIVNRIHTKLFYGSFTPEQRREVWLKLRPANLHIDDFEASLEQLAKLDLNGRDVKTVYRNAAKFAALEKLDTVPGRTLIEEAHDLLESTHQLMGGEAELELHKFGTPKNGHSKTASYADDHRTA